MSSVLTNYKVQGQTDLSAVIATVDIEHRDDGTLRFIPSTGGEPVTISDPNTLRLLAEALNISFASYP